jgi:hypothetical protein
MISNLADESLPGNGQMSELGLIFRLGRAKLRSPLYPQEQTSPAGPVGSAKRGHSARPLSYISELIATQIAPARALPPEMASPQRAREDHQGVSLVLEGRARRLSRAMFSQPVRGSNSHRKAA